MTLKFNASAIVVAVLLLSGCAHTEGDSVKRRSVTYHSVTVDGLRVDLPYIRVFENGQEVLWCQDYVKDVVKTPADGKTEITLGARCKPESAERFTL